MNTSFTGITEAADNLDHFTLVFTVISVVVILGMTLVTLYFCWRYHASRGHEKGENIQSGKLEIFWTAAVFVIFMGIFWWATSHYQKQVTLPQADYEVFVYGKRWMWKFYHQTGFAEVNHLHIPKDRNVRLIMTSKDVIHSFYLPSFRIKSDLLPDAYTYLNLKAKKNGEYTIYCAEYCGSYHSRMGGMTTVMDETDYKKLIHGTNPGEALFQKHGCINCHKVGSDVAPSLVGLAQKRDDNFIRRSILYPQEVVANGQEPNMPSFKGVLKEEEVNFLVQYIKTLGGK
jgi:cytochrome c oxidase subunit 2